MTDESEHYTAAVAREWRMLYNSLIAEGFLESAALEILKTYILAACGRK